jgi:hypothetical protein
MSFIPPLLIWVGAIAAFAPRFGQPASAVVMSAGAWLVVSSAHSWGSGIAEASAHGVAAVSLLAIITPLLRRGTSVRATRPVRRQGVGVVSRTEARYGWGRLSAALLGAPGGALLVSLVLPKLVPASQDLRYLTACLVIVPAVIIASWLALTARSGLRAWAGSVTAIVAALSVYWGTRP